MAAIYTVFTSPYHAPIPDHLPTLVVTPHGQPTHILYSYLHTDYNKVNYLLTPSPQGDLCVAKLFPPAGGGGTAAPSSSGHSGSTRQVVRCEASRSLSWSIENTGVRTPVYKVVNSDETPLYQISKPNPNSDFWTMFYFAYAGHQIPPRRAEFGKIQKNPPEKGGGTRITITGKTEDEKKVWQTLGEGNEDCVEWVVCCAALNLLDDEILKAASASAPRPSPAASPAPSVGIASSTPSPAPAATQLKDNGPTKPPASKASPAARGSPARVPPASSSKAPSRPIMPFKKGSSSKSIPQSTSSRSQQPSPSPLSQGQRPAIQQQSSSSNLRGGAPISSQPQQQQSQLYPPQRPAAPSRGYSNTSQGSSNAGYPQQQGYQAAGGYQQPPPQGYQPPPQQGYGVRPPPQQQQVQQGRRF